MSGVAAAGTRQFGIRIRQERASRGWSLRELGTKSGVSFNTISRAENGTGDIWLSHAVKIAAALGVPLSDLMKPPACEHCCDHPPPGFICANCRCETASPDGISAGAEPQ